MSINRGRVRWQCRRALLELDLAFARFLDTYFDNLTENQLENLDDLLSCDDYVIWSMVNGSRACENDRWKEIISLLRRSP